jgi:hypothetical protein
MALPVGNQTEYTADKAKTICERIAAGESLRKACEADGMPAPSTVCGWVLDDREGFAEQYARARRLQAERLADELFDIADDSTNDYMLKQSKCGEDYEVANPEVIGRSRLRVDTRKWYLSKVLPKLYGEKMHTEHSGTIGTTDLSDDELTRRLAELEQAKQQSER